MARKPKENYSAKPSEVHLKDTFGTPPYALDPILPYLRNKGIIWECAAGEWDIVRVLHCANLPVVATTMANDGSRLGDFFKDETIPARWDVLCTNPPFSRKFPWLARCYELGKPFGLIVPLDTIGAQSALALWEQYGAEWIFFDSRIDFLTPSGKDSSAQFASMWWTWGLGIGQPITVAHIKEAKKQYKREQKAKGLAA